MSDAVDTVRNAWSRERPDVDNWPVGVVGRTQRLARVLEDELQSFFRQFGLDTGEVDVLFTLRRSGAPYGLMPTQLVKTLMVTSGAVTKRINRLEARKFVERIPDTLDRRIVQVRLTKQGLAMVDRIFAPHIANEARLLEGLDRDKLDQLADLLRTLLQSLGDTPRR
ncbi:MAG: MarR family transcriptional regulator [Mesorhizobium sp.]|uniref:MarR family winged helix-turn-helix transcriptional regulator n=1 Tax=Mesorhizobium sp. TaxID=1871066 RepID=UPI000FE46377|nr:MarR family transcriptional regulator [Mesorhizobium sp.]RWL76793.1 MAG: MarR family transcriptional regulator [Mesorhizobium sp.]RWL81459.1 MAG: MarR family transcriptional regulator [Mesorhizobium sp.]RWL96644.1 MAG: MarR family transcriptional regulator [Mesorhizobium sp.]TIP03145.1 MAG: MarR family transcriptional regulator [Mesorhizobium sp.]